MRYDRNKLWWTRLAFWVIQIPVLVVLFVIGASTQELVWYGLGISVLTGIEACLPSE